MCIRDRREEWGHTNKLSAKKYHRNRNTENYDTRENVSQEGVVFYDFISDLYAKNIVHFQS